MSENVEGRRGGRPAGADPKTIEFGRWCIDAKEKFGHSVAEIAVAYNMTASNVHRCITAAREGSQNSGQTEGAREAEGPDGPPLLKPRKLGLSTVRARASYASRTDRGFSGLDSNMKMIWQDIIDEIHLAGVEGVELRFEKPGRHHSMEKFVDSFGATMDQVQTLIDRALLVELPDGGIAMPFQFGLRPKPMAARSRVRQSGPPPSGQGHLLHSIQGGRVDSTEKGVSLESFVSKIRPEPENSSTENGVSLESAGPAHASSSSSSDSDSTGLGGGGRKKERANDSSETPPDSSETPVAAPSSVLADELARLAKLARPAQPAELVMVEAWSEDGLTRDMMERVVGKVMARAKPPVLVATGLAYFEKLMREEAASVRKAKNGAPPPTAANGHAEPAPQRSHADELAWARMVEGRFKLGSVPKEQAETPLGLAWIAKLNAWHRAGHPDADRPPCFEDFRLDARP